MPERVEKPLI